MTTVSDKGPRPISGLSEEVLAKLSQPTIPLLEAGRLLFNLSERGTYAAAKKGDLPMLRMGRKLFCPTAPLRRMIGLDEPDARQVGNPLQTDRAAA